MTTKEVASEKVFEDIVIVADAPRKSKRDKMAEDLAGLIAQLEQVGLAVRKTLSYDSSQLFLFIGATEETLESHAELRQFELRLKVDTSDDVMIEDDDDIHGSPFAPFHVSQRELFAPASPYSLFTRSQRQRLVLDQIEASHDQGGAGISLGDLCRRGVIVRHVALHDSDVVRSFVRSWLRRPWRRTPLDGIADYFGEASGFFFAFLSFIWPWLLAAAIPGVVAEITRFAVPGEDGWSFTAFSLFIAIWASICLEMWSRRENVLRWEWNMEHFRESQRTRPEYEGVERLGVWQGTTFVPLREGEVYGIDPPRPVKFGDPIVTKRRMALGSIVMVTLICVVVIVAVAFLSFRLLLQSIDIGSGFSSTVKGNWGGFVGSLCSAIVIEVLNRLYRLLARRITRWENHRTKAEFDKFLTIKIFLFNFVNS